MSGDEKWKDFADKLKALSKSAYQAAEAMNRASRSTIKAACDLAYTVHGAPFGRQPGAQAIWLMYRQYTTQN